MGPEQAVDDAMQRICAGSVSTHALREEGDAERSVQVCVDADFNPRPPRGERPAAIITADFSATFQSTLSARRATGSVGVRVQRIVISIHALREEGDQECNVRRSRATKFQSTPSARRATACQHQRHLDGEYFNPRPPRGGRLPRGCCVTVAVKFQSTPSARRATSRAACLRRRKQTFQSTPSARRATETYPAGGGAVYISIHALREEGDRKETGRTDKRFGFQSTPSARRATGMPLGVEPSQQISIHALREEGDKVFAPRTDEL